MSTRRLVALVLLALGCTPSPVALDDAATPGGDASTSGDAASAADAGPLPDGAPAPDAHVAPSVTGVDQIFAGEYVTSFLHDGRVYSVAGTAARRGSGDHPPDAVYPPSEVAFPDGVRIVTGAGGLHFTIAADTEGHVYEWGDIEANPRLVDSTVPVRATNEDGSPFVLPGGVRSMAASVGTSIAAAGDGSVWVWDDCANGLAGDGTDGDARTLHPTRVDLPDDADIVQVAIGEAAFARGADGRIWAWGSGGATENLGTGELDYRTPHVITETSTGEPMPPVIEITTSGQSYAYALTASGDVYAWGVYLHIAGACPGSGWCPSSRPRLSNDVVAEATAGGARVTSITASSGGSYVVTSDGAMWGWGTNGQGLVGNGVAPDYATTPTPYAWDWDKDALLVTRAVRIAPERSDFVRVISGSALVFYAYAATRDGRLFSWGRNKTGNLGNGVVPLNSQQAARYPNSWDVIVPTEVFPLTAPEMPVSSPHCEANPEAESCWCGGGREGPQTC